MVDPRSSRPALPATGAQPAVAGAAPAPGRRGLRRGEWAAVAVFAAVAVAGTFYAKWHPYYLKGFHVAASRSLGASIVSGHAATAPAGWQAALDFARIYAEDIWQALVVGLLIAAGVQELLPRRLLLRALSGSRRRSVGIGTLVAVPSMMCTCCSAPPTVALTRSRVPVGATVAYWLGNPLINPATFVFAGLVLGWRWAVLRVGMGAVIAVAVAAGAQRLFGGVDVPAAAEEALAAAVAADERRGSLPRRYALTVGRLAVGLIPEYAVAVLALGAARAFLFPAMSPSVGHAAWLVLVLAVTGTLFVVPTAGEIPVVQTLLAFGLGAGGAGALLITLPAVSLPSMAMVSRALPSRVVAYIAASVVVAGLVTAAVAVAVGL